MGLAILASKGKEILINVQRAFQMSHWLVHFWLRVKVDTVTGLDNYIAIVVK